MRAIVPIVCAGLLAMLAGCGGGDGGGGGEVCDNAQCLTDEGWQLFEQGQYQNAIAKFNEALTKDPAYADAYNGLGWSYANLDSLNRALKKFGLCIANGMTTADPYAGCAPVYRDAGFITGYLDSGVWTDSTALAKDSDYEFSHDDTFDSDDLHLILAQCYYRLGRYLDAKAEVELLGGPVLDPQDEDFEEDLAAAIQDLEASIGG